MSYYLLIYILHNAKMQDVMPCMSISLMDLVFSAYLKICKKNCKRNEYRTDQPPDLFHQKWNMFLPPLLNSEQSCSTEQVTAAAGKGTHSRVVCPLSNILNTKTKVLVHLCVSAFHCILSFLSLPSSH